MKLMTLPFPNIESVINRFWERDQGRWKWYELLTNTLLIIVNTYLLTSCLFHVHKTFSSLSTFRVPYQEEKNSETGSLEETEKIRITLKGRELK